MRRTSVILLTLAAFLVGGAAGVLVAPAALHLASPYPAATSEKGWAEIPWPFPIDQFGRGKAFRCAPAECGSAATLYVRAKIGFCNCATGVSDDAELERISDLVLAGDNATARGDGRPIAVAHMKGRSRSYLLSGGNRLGKSALSIGFNDRCDAISALVVVDDERPERVEASALAFLNAPAMIRWAEVTLGL